MTEADRMANRVLRKALVRNGEGWLSEESTDDLTRLKKDRIWVVDPLDGTREFVAGIPEWCISVGLVEHGRAVAGGVCNPATGEIFLGGLGQEISRNGKPIIPSDCKSLSKAVVLASRSEAKRGEWDCFRQGFCNATNGLGCVQTCFGGSRYGGCHLELSPQERMGYCRGNRSR